MAVDFSAFDQLVDMNALQQDVKNAQDSMDVPDGTYVVSIEKMELTVTKAEKKPMFAVQMKIKEGEHKGRMLFFNRVVYGNKNTETWNDGRAIKSVCTWVNELLNDGDEPIEFINYSDFAEQILDVFQMLQNTVEVEVDYAAKKFNPITIKEVFDLA